MKKYNRMLYCKLIMTEWLLVDYDHLSFYDMINI